MHTCSSTKAKCPDSYYLFGVATKTCATFCFSASSAGVGGAAGFAAGATTGCSGTACTGFGVVFAALAPADVVVVVDSFAASLCGQGGTLQTIGIGTAFCASAMRREAASSAGSGKADQLLFGRVAFFARYFTTCSNIRVRLAQRALNNTQNQSPNLASF